MNGIQCQCGRFLARAHATTGTTGEGYSWARFIAEIRGDCSRCGPDSPAMKSGWWWAWDAWNWPAELEVS